MPINVDYPDLLALFPEYLDPKRSESASFLIWYLENYSRLDPSEAVDAVCDQSGDHGVDGVVVNDNDQTITVYQSRISQSSDSTVGDNALKTFAGTLLQFKDAASVEAMINSAGDARVGSLASSLDLVNKIATHEIRGEFLSNIDIDANGEAFLRARPEYFVRRQIKACRDAYIRRPRIAYPYARRFRYRWLPRDGICG
jgi:hypothetical protein